MNSIANSHAALAPLANDQRRVYVKTFGCQMNVYDSQKMLDALGHRDYTPCLHPEDADLILFNTCSIREKAQEKVFHELGRVRAYKQRGNKQVLIGVGGCVASQEGQAIIDRAPYVDLVFGPQTLHKLPDMVARCHAGEKNVVDIDPVEVIEKFDLVTQRSETTLQSAFVSIMEGCDKYCSFCIVPYTRGREVSRSLDSILEEVINLSGQGVREIVLLGQNVNAWQGFNATQTTEYDLAFLLECVAEIPNVDRIRFTTSHPCEMTDRLINTFGQIEQLVPHLHLPVQSGSDRILSAMRRGYTALEYKSIVRKLRNACPEIALSSDFIVGFPGESAHDFQATLDLIRWAQFDTSFSFIYSPRPGTPATFLTDDVSLAEKKDRLQRLQRLLNDQSSQFSAQMLGQTVPVLLEGKSKRNDLEWQARTANNRIVNFALPTGKTPPQGLFDLEITEVFTNSLRGQWSA